LRGSIKELAINLSKKYKTNDPFVLAEYLGIHMCPWDFQEDTRGLYFYEKRQKFIYLNKSHNSNEQRVTCGHEVGHSILHKDINFVFMKTHTLFNMNKYEKAANIFCVELILPDSKIKTYDNFTLEQIASIENIPPQLLKLKFQ